MAAPSKDLRSAKLFDIANHPGTSTVDRMQLASGGVRVTGRLTVRGFPMPTRR